MRQQLKRLSVVVVVAALLVALAPTETLAVADIYRDAVSCSFEGSGDWYCEDVVVWSIGVSANIACAGASTGMGWFTWGYTWIIGAFYCATAGTI